MLEWELLNQRIAVYLRAKGGWFSVTKIAQVNQIRAGNDLKQRNRNFNSNIQIQLYTQYFTETGKLNNP